MELHPLSARRRVITNTSYFQPAPYQLRGRVGRVGLVGLVGLVRDYTDSV